MTMQDVVYGTKGETRRRPGMRRVRMLVWTTVAVVVHVAIGFAAAAGSANRPTHSLTPSEVSTVSFVRVDVPPQVVDPVSSLDATERAPSEPAPDQPAATTAAQPEQPVKAAEPAARRTARKEKKAAAATPKPEVGDPFADFADFGALEGSTSSSGTIAVSTGSSASGPLSSGGSTAGARRLSTERQPERAAAGSTDGAKEPEPVEVVSRRTLDKKARPDERFNRTIKAVYPPEKKIQGAEADVVLLAVVSSGGGVSSVRVVNQVDREFALAAVQAVKRFRFDPAIRGGDPVGSEVRLVYRFRIEDA